MIRSFACADTDALFHSRAVSRFRNIERDDRMTVTILKDGSLWEWAEVRWGFPG